MIDTQTGGLNISQTAYISPGTTLERIVNLNLGEKQELIDMHNGWKWVTAKNVQSGHDYFILSFGFQADALIQVNLIVSEHKFDLTTDWNNWSEENEINQLANLQKWLKEEVGPIREFNWGSAEALYDSKSGTSLITLNYN